MNMTWPRWATTVTFCDSNVALRDDVGHIARSDGVVVFQPGPVGDLRIGDRDDRVTVGFVPDADDLHLLVAVDALAVGGRVAGEDQPVAGLPSRGRVGQHQRLVLGLGVDGQLFVSW